MNLKKFWYLKMRNNVVREGESAAFKWRFRRFWLDVETKSGNWKARWMADEHPYAYLLAGKGDENVEGFCQMVYEVSMLLTTDQGFVDDVVKAVQKYSKRLEKAAAKEAKKDDEGEEIAAIEFEKEVEAYKAMPKRYRRRKDRELDKKLKEIEKNGMDVQ